MTIEQAISELNLYNTAFRAIQIADLLYPNARYDDREGRVYNHSVPAVARRLRACKWIQEIKPGVFYAPKISMLSEADAELSKL